MSEPIATLPLTIPRAAENARPRVIEDFREAGLKVEIDGVFVTKAVGPPPDANFFIDLARHVETYEVDHILDELNGAVGAAIVLAFKSVSKWIGARVGIHFLLPGKPRQMQYIMPGAPEAEAAIGGIRKHYKSLSSDHANEYFWKYGRWMSAEEYFAGKKAREGA